jgi:hypothetical protein
MLRHSRDRLLIARLSTGFALLFVASSGSLAVSGQQTSQPLLITGARVLDVVAGRYQSAAAVLIEGDRITGVYLKAPPAVPADARELDLAGLTLVPGLGDMHLLAAPTAALDVDYFLALSLAFGVTMARTPNAPLPWATAERGRVEAGELDSPHIWTSGPGIDEAPSSRLWLHEVRDVAGATREVLDQVQAKVDWIAVYGNTAAEVYRAAIATAHASGVRVTGVASATSMVDLARMSIDSIEGLGYPARNRAAYEQAFNARSDFPKDDPPAVTEYTWAHMPEADARLTVAQLVRSRTVLVPMLAASMENLQREDIAKDGDLDRLPASRRDQLLARFAGTGPTSTTSPGGGWTSRAGFLRALAAAGGRIATGTDFEGTGYPLPGAGVHKELALLVRAGLTPLQAIRAATVNCAELVGAEKRLGQIKAGYEADLIAVEGDPLRDIGDLGRIRLIVRGGEVLERQELLDQARRAIVIKE